MPSPDVVSIIVACHNEADNLPDLHRRIEAACQSFEWELVLVNDGSADDTVGAVRKLQAQDKRVRLISFSRNCGQQAALRAGLRAANGDVAVTMDADLQHPPESIPDMVARAREGADIVVMVHDEPQRGFCKELLSRWFYRLYSALTGVRFHHRASDFRLVSRRVLGIINRFPERNLFLRASLLTLGFPVVYQKYRLGTRQKGTPSYTLGKSISLATDALFNTSTIPIRLLFFAGLGIAGAAFLYGMINVILRLVTDLSVPGYTDIIASVLFLGGLNLIMLSVVAKYVQVVLEHVQQRPEYLIDERNSDPPADNRR
jgi:dolichol-phosphate mannosyltransferase